MAEKFSIGQEVYIDDEGKAHRPNASVQGYDDNGEPIFVRVKWIPISEMHHPERGISVGMDMTGQPVIILHDPIPPKADAD